MPTALPPILNFIDPATTEGGEKAALSALRQYLADLLNTTGVAADAFLRTGWGVGEVKIFAYDFAPVDDGIVKIVEADGQSYLRSTYADAFSKLGTLWGSVDGTHFNVPNARERAWAGAGAATYALSFLPAAVNTGTSVITVASNEGLYLGSPVLFTTTGTPPAPLVNSTIYYWLRTGPTTGALSTTLANAVAGIGITITTQGTGVHTIAYSLTTRAVGTYLGEEAHANTIAETASHNHIQDPHSHQFQLQKNNGGSGGDYSTGLASAPVTYNTLNATATNQATGGSTAHNNLPPRLIGKHMIKLL